MHGLDLLKVHYYVILENRPIEEMSPFQGFQDDWGEVNWALVELCRMPADVLEGVAPLDRLIAQRMGGARSLAWSPLMITALEQVKPRDLGLFVVLFSGVETIAKRIEEWRASDNAPTLHVSLETMAGVVHPLDLKPDTIIAYCRDAFSARENELDPMRRESARNALAGWTPRPPVPLALKEYGHNVLAPNQMSLRRAWRELGAPEWFMSNKPEDYDDRILESIKAVFDVRDHTCYPDFMRMTLLHPELYLVEPALFRTAYRAPSRLEASVAKQVIRQMQTQRGFITLTNGQFIKDFAQSQTAQWIMALRQRELETFTRGVGLAAAQSCSGVMRLGPGVNHVFPQLTALANSIRSEKAEHRRKAYRLFTRIQDDLKATIGSARMAFIESDVSGPIKIVSDAPLEWLPVRGLPLNMRFQCSRLNATPGNLLMGLLAKTALVTVTPASVQEVLVVSAFEPTDKLRDLLTRAFEVTRPMWDGKVKITFKKAATVSEFIDALNAFEGAILLFDGHGAPHNDDGVGKLMIGAEPLDVWSLRGKARIPPIVLLSACDTQGIDSPTHATVGNGFLAAGAQTVVATMLPVGGANSAGFFARFMHRLAEFIPAALSAHQRVLNWSEVVWGMQRMLLASDLLNELVGDPSPRGTPRWELQRLANEDINTGEPDWYENLIDRVAKHLNEQHDIIAQRAARIVARAEAIRYVQLGHPENILIDDGSIVAQFVSPDFLAALEASGDQSAGVGHAP